MYKNTLISAVPEINVKIADRIAATLAIPASKGPHPGVLMLHGFASSRDEVGGAFARLAVALSTLGIASLRIDFSGWGESEGDMADTTVRGQVTDALQATKFLQGHTAIDRNNLGLLGFSFGGGVATAVAAQTQGAFRSLALWGSVGSFPDDMTASLGEVARQEATASGSVIIDLGWRTICLRRSFFESLDDVDILGAIGAFHGSFLALAGTNDRLAVYLEQFITASAAQQKIAYRIAAADHIFNILDSPRSQFSKVMMVTTNWFSETLRVKASLSTR